MFNREINAFRKKVTKNTVRFALVYPSLYEAMVASLGVHMLYFMINENYDEVYIERFHVQRVSRGEAPNRSLETGSLLKDFELIFTSIHYEPDIANLIKIMHSSGLEPLSSLRGTPVVAGGPAVMMNPHPYSDIIDVMVIGEIEETIPRIVEKWLEHRFDKKRFLEEVSELEYTYVPSVDGPEEKVYRRWTTDLNNSYYPLVQFRSLDIEHPFGDGFMLETSRGCRFWCRFCVESRLFKPYRYRSFDTMKKIVEKGLALNGVNRVLLYALSFPSNLDEKRIAEYVVFNGYKIAVPSLRLDNLDSDFMDLIKAGGQLSLTLAPESFSTFTQRLIAKYFNVDSTVSKIIELINRGFNIKLYLMYGFPGERATDIKVTLDVLKGVASRAREKGVELKISLNPLIPKPHTVFQWFGMASLEKARRTLKIYLNELPGFIDTRFYELNYAWVQATICLADRSIGRVLVQWGVDGGGLGAWRRALKDLSYRFDYVFKGWRYGDKLPWSNIILNNENEKVLEAEYDVFKRLLSTN